MKQVTEIPRTSNGAALYLHFTGGFRAAQLAKDAWRIEPVLVDGKPCQSAPLSKSELQTLGRRNGFRAVAFHQFSWIDGEYNSSWLPITPGEANHTLGPSDLWGSIASNLYRKRAKIILESSERLTDEELAKIHDDRAPEEALARYISVSLRNMDISVEQIAEHYHEQLVNHMAAGRVNGEQATNTSSQKLFAHVHSFYMHLGAARDYLGALIACRIGFDPSRIDSMARLVRELRLARAPSDPLIELLLETGNIAPDPERSARLKVAGWMEDVTTVRNDLIHKHPYGSKSSEEFGWTIPTKDTPGLYRYVRPIELSGNAGHDVFDVLNYHYKKFAELMNNAARASGHDSSITHITDGDLISQRVIR